MDKFLIFLNRLINFYLYYVVMACFLSLVPYINPNFPLFKFIFTSAGFYLVPPILGISFSPAIIMIILVFCSQGINKIYEKYFAQKEQKIIIMSPEEFIQKINQDKTFFEEKNIKEQEEVKRKDDNQ